MGWMRRLLYGRYGTDQLNYALMALSVVFYLLSGLFFRGLLEITCTLCLVVCVYRMFSRQMDKRRMENAKFLEAVQPLVRWYNVNKCRRRDKDHCYFRCPNCGQQLRVPKGKGRISITCRSCGATFEEKT